MSQKFVNKYPPTVGIQKKELSIAEVVKVATDSPFLDQRIEAIVSTIKHMASIMQEGEQVRLAELLHHVPVLVPFSDPNSGLRRN
jgi:mevalonate pyrophosphate decarboxylase